MRHGYGLLLVLTKSYAEAENELREAVWLDPNTAIVHSDLADVLAQKGKDEEAKEQYGVAHRIDPNLDVANLGLGMISARNGDVVSSRNYCEAAARSNDIRE